MANNIQDKAIFTSVIFCGWTLNSFRKLILLWVNITFVRFQTSYFEFVLIFFSKYLNNAVPFNGYRPSGSSDIYNKKSNIMIWHFLFRFCCYHMKIHYFINYSKLLGSLASRMMSRIWHCCRRKIGILDWCAADNLYWISLCRTIALWNIGATVSVIKHFETELFNNLLNFISMLYDVLLKNIHLEQKRPLSNSIYKTKSTIPMKNLLNVRIFTDT